MGLDGDFEVGVDRRPGWLVVRPHGELDIATVEALRRSLAARDGDEGLALDLRGLGFLDTSGLQLVLETFRRARTEDWELVVVRGPRSVQRVFEIAGLEDMLPFADAAPGDDATHG